MRRSSQYERVAAIFPLSSATAAGGQSRIAQLGGTSNFACGDEHLIIDTRRSNGGVFAPSNCTFWRQPTMTHLRARSHFRDCKRHSTAIAVRRLIESECSSCFFFLRQRAHFERCAHACALFTHDTKADAQRKRSLLRAAVLSPEIER